MMHYFNTLSRPNFDHGFGTGIGTRFVASKSLLRRAMLVTGFFVLLFLLPKCFAAGNMVDIKTNMGVITVELDAQRAPSSTQNFLAYCKNGFYRNTIFHRVIGDFMVQGGGFEANMQQKAPRKAIANEAKNGLKNMRGTLAMARTSDPHSATSQFFINLKDNYMLDYPGQDGWGYAVFGRVVQGMDVVDKMANVATTSVGPHQNVPVSPITILSTTIR